MDLQEYLDFLYLEIEKTIWNKDKERLKKIRTTLEITWEFINLQKK